MFLITTDNLKITLESLIKSLNKNDLTDNSSAKKLYLVEYIFVYKVKHEITNMCKTDFLYSFNTSITKMLQMFPIKPNVHINTENASFTLVKPDKLFCSVIKPDESCYKSCYQNN